MRLKERNVRSRLKNWIRLVVTPCHSVESKVRFEMSPQITWTKGCILYRVDLQSHWSWAVWLHVRFQLTFTHLHIGSVCLCLQMCPQICEQNGLSGCMYTPNSSPLASAAHTFILVTFVKLFSTVCFQMRSQIESTKGCVFYWCWIACTLRTPILWLWRRTPSYWLHSFSFSPRCVFKCILKLK